MELFTVNDFLFVRILYFPLYHNYRSHQFQSHLIAGFREARYNSFTLKCLSIGTPKAINFPFVSNEKLMIFRCPIIQAHYNEAVIYLNFGTPKNNEFSIWNKWKICYF